MSVLVVAAAAVVVDIHDGSLTAGVPGMAAAVDTHDGSVDTVDWFRVCFENVTTDAKHDDQLSKVKSSSYNVSVSCKLSSS